MNDLPTNLLNDLPKDLPIDLVSTKVSLCNHWQSGMACGKSVCSTYVEVKKIVLRSQVVVGLTLVLVLLETVAGWWHGELVAEVAVVAVAW